MIEIDNEKYYSPKETAKKLDLTVGRIAQLRKEGMIKYVKVSERKYLYSEQAIKDYVLFSKF
jgi:hypothetical protein